MNTLTAAINYMKAGLSVIPVGTDKRPALRAWKQHQETIPAEIEIRRWFKRDRNVAIIGGAVSGGLLIIDFDYQADTIYPAWRAMLNKNNPDIPELPTVKTGKGYHVYLRCPEPGGNQKLARNTTNVYIETRGEGGYVLAPPSLHQNGARYTLLNGDLTNIPRLTQQQMFRVLDTCRFFDDHTGEPPPLTATITIPTPQIPDTGKDRYIQAAIDSEVAAVQAAPTGNRNNQLFISTAAIAEFAGAGFLTEQMVRDIMSAAAAHLMRDEPQATRRTIESGIKRGLAKPRIIPPRPAPNQSQEKIDKLDINTAGPKTQDFFKAFSYLGYEFRMNVLDDTVEMNGQPLTDAHAAIIKNKMRDIGLTSTGRIFDAYTELAYRNQYHPVKQYFDSLKWDGVNHIGKLVNNHMQETTGFGETAFRRWMIGSVAKIYQKAQNVMLVWDGPQGIGKSYLARWLCPLQEYFMEGPIKPDDKDFALRLATKWVWEVAELQSTTRKADREALKGFITLEDVTLRKAYGRYDITKPAMASLVGTINEDGAGFLTDPTGNRRFAIINIHEIDWNYTKLDIASLWAQAVALYKMGESWRLTPEELIKQQQINEQYQMSSVFSEMFFACYDIDPEDTRSFATAAEILNAMKEYGLTGNQQGNMNELGRLMKSYNVKRGRPRTGEGRPTAYYGVKRVGAVGEDVIPF